MATTDHFYPNVKGPNNTLMPNATADAFRRAYDLLYKHSDQLASPFLGYTVVTLSPDTKPILGTADAGRLVYAEDFDKWYRWTGVNWSSVNATFQDIHFFITEPTTNGWQLCDGSGALASMPDASVISITTPNLVDDIFITGAASYSGPTASPAVAPGATGTGTATGSSTGTVGGSAIIGGAATIVGAATASGITDPAGAHTHTYSGTTSSNGSHTHTGVVTGADLDIYLSSNAYAMCSFFIGTSHGFTDVPINLSDDAPWNPTLTIPSSTYTTGTGVSGDAYSDTGLTSLWEPYTDAAVNSDHTTWNPTLTIPSSTYTTGSGSILITDLESALTHNHVLSGTTDPADLGAHAHVGPDTFTLLDVSTAISNSDFTFANAVNAGTHPFIDGTSGSSLSGSASLTKDCFTTETTDLSTHDHGLSGTTDGVDTWDTTSGDIAFSGLTIPAMTVSGFTTGHVHNLSAAAHYHETPALTIPTMTVTGLTIHYHEIDDGSLETTFGTYIPVDSPSVSLTIDSNGAHTHTYSGTTSSNGSHSHTFTGDVDISGMGVDISGMTIDLSGVTVAITTTVTITSMTITIDDTGTPKRMALLPYIRL